MSRSPSWQEWPQRLWGDEWIAPMSEVLGINRRTIERWRAEEGRPNGSLCEELRGLALRPDARIVGGILRRMARGETLEDIREDARAVQNAVARIVVDRGRYRAIHVLGDST